MSLTSEIIKWAHRESNLIALGKEPSAEQTAEALPLLNRLVSGVYGFEVGDRLFDWPIGNVGVVASTSWNELQWTKLLPNVRMIANANAPQTVYLPPEPEDGARVALVDPGDTLTTYPITVNANGRRIEGGVEVVMSTAGEDRIWFYRADMGEWLRLTELVNDPAEEFPFPEKFDDFFVTRLAMRINPRYGRAMQEASVAELQKVERKLRAQYEQTQIIPADLGVLALTNNYNPDVEGRIVRGRMGWMN